MSLKYGIIGFGKMGRIRTKLLEEYGYYIGGISDPLQEYTNKYKIFDNPYDLIKDEKISAIFISTPNYLIKDLVIAALKNGKHVFAEKPPGISLNEVLEMKEEAEKHPDQVLKFGFNHRYHGAVIEAKKQIDSGKFGKILWIRGRYGKSVDEDFKNSWRAKKEYAGHGILLDQGIHMLDLFLHFCGNFEEVKAFCSKQYWGLDIEDNVFAIFRNQNGQTASLHSTMTQWRHLFALEIFLEKGYMVINGILSSTGSYTNGTGVEELTIALNRSPAPVAKHSQEEKLKFSTDLSFKNEVDEFLNCIKTNSCVKYGSIHDAEKLMTLIDKIYQDDLQ